MSRRNKETVVEGHRVCDVLGDGVEGEIAGLLEP